MQEAAWYHVSFKCPWTKAANPQSFLILYSIKDSVQRNWNLWVLYLFQKMAPVQVLDLDPIKNNDEDDESTCQQRARGQVEHIPRRDDGRIIRRLMGWIGFSQNIDDFHGWGCSWMLGRVVVAGWSFLEVSMRKVTPKALHSSVSLRRN